jgi:hypothetical protein
MNDTAKVLPEKSFSGTGTPVCAWCLIRPDLSEAPSSKPLAVTEPFRSTLAQEGLVNGIENSFVLSWRPQLEAVPALRAGIARVTKAALRGALALYFSIVAAGPFSSAYR